MPPLRRGEVAWKAGGVACAGAGSFRQCCRETGLLFSKEKRSRKAGVRPNAAEAAPALLHIHFWRAAGGAGVGKGVLYFGGVAHVGSVQRSRQASTLQRYPTRRHSPCTEPHRSHKRAGALLRGERCTGTFAHRRCGPRRSASARPNFVSPLREAVRQRALPAPRSGSVAGTARSAKRSGVQGLSPC